MVGGGASGADVWLHDVMECLAGRLDEPKNSGRRVAVALEVEQAAILAAAGADVLAVETMGDLAEAGLAVDAIRSVTTLPVVLSFTVDANLRTLMGATPEQAVATALAHGADVVGSNCGVGPDEAVRAVARMRAAAPAVLSFTEPNAGPAHLEGERAVYPAGPARFADYAETAARQGGRPMGACCGATPEHIRAMATRLAAN